MAGLPSLRLIVDVPPDVRVARAALDAGADMVAVWTMAPGWVEEPWQGFLRPEELAAFAQALGGRVLPRFAANGHSLAGLEGILPYAVPWIGIDRLRTEDATQIHAVGSRVLCRQEVDGDGDLGVFEMEQARALEARDQFELVVHGSYLDGWEMLLNGISVTTPADLARLCRAVPTILVVPAVVVGDAVRVAPSVRGVTLAMQGSGTLVANYATLDDIAGARQRLHGLERSDARIRLGADGRPASERPRWVLAQGASSERDQWPSWFAPLVATTTPFGTGACGELFLTDDAAGLAAAVARVGGRVVETR